MMDIIIYLFCCKRLSLRCT